MIVVQARLAQGCSNIIMVYADRVPHVIKLAMLSAWTAHLMSMELGLDVKFMRQRGCDLHHSGGTQQLVVTEDFLVLKMLSLSQES